MFGDKETSKKPFPYVLLFFFSKLNLEEILQKINKYICFFNFQKIAFTKTVLIAHNI